MGKRRCESTAKGDPSTPGACLAVRGDPSNSGTEVRW